MQKLALFSILFFFLSACSIFQKTPHNIVLEEIKPKDKSIIERSFYQESPSRKNDLLHTKIAVSFDWAKKHVLGTAYLDFKPYFTSQNTVTLDAKGFDLFEVSLVKENGDKKELTYRYDSLQIFINLDKEYTREETYTIFVDYTAKPNDLNVEGSAAITDAKGLYFINPDGKEKKAMQIWTQGAPESNSAWFPCIDKPNERCTQEIAITVQNKFITLSNGLMVASTKNLDGTRTDVWEQKIEHAPYLIMLAVGEFHETKDVWRDINLYYYVEKEEAKHAKRIFGKTPEMIEFYSKLLGVDYPWEKYAQIIVRDFVSGAMENTTAVIHGEFVYSDEREFIDDPNEMIIAHELFHHWFGNLVTCESWPNVPLNEAFATYGEYLWMEGKYSKDAADHYLHKEMLSYLKESERKQVDFIRFDNENPNEMFDNHSYAKGGRILHMLRQVLGDDAFFKGLQHYLTKHANEAVEVHQLRLALEEISGYDLNWFFNQWFLASGHPILSITNEIEKDSINITILQEQDLSKTPLYKLPATIDLYENETIKSYDIEISKQKQNFKFPASTKPNLIVFDSNHSLLAEIQFKKSDEEWIYQLKNSRHYFDRLEALDSLSQSQNFANKSRAIKIALNDSFWAIRTKALNYFNITDPRTKSILETKLIELAKKDTKSNVRAAAIQNLSLHFDQKKNMPSHDHTMLYKRMSTDSSYIVAAEALKALSIIDLEAAYTIAKKELNTAKKELLNIVFYVIAKNGLSEDAKIIQTEFDNAEGYEIIEACIHLVEFSKKQKAQDYPKLLEKVTDKYNKIDVWYYKVYMLNSLKKFLENSEGLFKSELEKIIKEIIEQEKNPKILQYLRMSE